MPAFTATGRSGKTVPYATVFRLLFAMSLCLSGCRQARESSVLSEPRAEIIVRPARVFHRGEVQLEAELALPRRAAYSWAASQGKLLSNDSNLVFWEAPASGKSCLITVTVQLEGSVAAPISMAGVVLSQPIVNTTPSMG